MLPKPTTHKPKCPKCGGTNIILCSGQMCNINAPITLTVTHRGCLLDFDPEHTDGDLDDAAFQCSDCGKDLDFADLQQGEEIKDECAHQLDVDNMTVATDCPIEVVDDMRLKFTMDVPCAKCGISGSFPVEVLLRHVDW